MTSIVNNVASVIMTGGKSRRMNNKNKSFIKLNDIPLITYVIKSISLQSNYIVINANRDINMYNEFGYDVVSDSIKDYPGPLAGVLSGMDWILKSHIKCKWLFTSPTDAPFIPNDIIERLYLSCIKSNKYISLSKSRGRVHPVFALWNLSLVEDLRKSIIKGTRKVEDFTINYNPSIVDFYGDIDPFFNINTPEDLKVAQSYI